MCAFLVTEAKIKLLQKDVTASGSMWKFKMTAILSLIYGLFRQSLNGTGTGTGTIGFIEYYARYSHCNWSGTGTGTGNLADGFQTHFLQLTR